MTAARRQDTLALWRWFASKPGGRWAFSRLLCLKAPYFGTIRPQFVELRPERCELRMRKRRGVQNHIGTVHAIAMCNMAELAAGTMTEVTIPATHRWIPKRMTVNYVKLAKTDLTAVATPHVAHDWSEAGDFLVDVAVRDAADEVVFEACVTMWVSQRG